jgi:hypothetical protein
MATKKPDVPATDPDRISSDEFGTTRPKLDPDDLEGDVAVLTIAEFEKFGVRDTEAEEGSRTTAVLRFTTTGDKSLWLNKTMIATLIERLGDRPKEWAGKLCPVEKRKVTFRNQTHLKVYVMASEEWDETIAEYQKQEKQKKGGRR